MNNSLNHDLKKNNFRIMTVAILVATLLPSIYSYFMGTPTSQVMRLIQAIPTEIILVGIVFFLGSKVGLNAIGFKKPEVKKLYWLIPEVLLLFAILSSIASPAADPSPKVILQLLSLAVLVGIYEELLSRGIVLHVLARYGKVEMAIIGSGLVFGVLHFSSYDGTNGVATFQQIVETIAAGTYGAVIALALRSIIPLMFTHFLYDFFLFIRMYFEDMSTDPLVQGASYTPSLLDFSNYIIPLLYLLVALVIYFFEKKNIKQYHQELQENAMNRQEISKGEIMVSICKLSGMIVGFNLIIKFLL